MSLRPEQRRALDYARRRGTEAGVDEVRAKVASAFRNLESLLLSLPETVAKRRPAPARWSVQEVVDHLVESHRPAVEQLRELVSGRSPAGGPIPAGLLSPGAMDRPWSAVVADLQAVHRDFLGELDRTDEATPLTARAAVEMVVRCATPDGALEPVHWVETFDWKAYAILIRAHSLEHLQQAQRALAATGGSDRSLEPV